MTSNDIFDFGLRLKTLRQSKRLSQAELADKLGVSKGTIYRYETNTQAPSLEIASRLALIFGVSLDYLAGLEQQLLLRLPPMSKEQQTVLQDFVRLFLEK